MATNYPLEPPLQCDVVLKGGITSGVIYPRLICELAKVYRLRSVGGASAGAIAASAAAAAELGRATGGFDQLESLPDDITAKVAGGGSVLYRLFQPQPATAGLYRAFTASLGRRGITRAVALTFGLLRAYWPWAAVGLIPGAAAIVLGVFGTGPARWAAVVAGAVLVVLGVAFATLSGVLRSVAKHVPANGFGMCNGMPGVGSKADALTPWLHHMLQRLAGRGPQEEPLTFGALRAAGVELRMMTTNLTRRQPTALPGGAGSVFFDPVRWRELFPADVVHWMEQHPGAVDAELAAAAAAHDPPLLPWPDGDDLPILVATRISLSFPLLLTAVPTYGVDRDATALAGDGKPRFGVNWWSDGGICSNLPVHFFDAPLPTRPTFAIDLAGFPAGQRKSADECDNSFLPTQNSQIVNSARRWTTWPAVGIGAVPGFLHAIVQTARAWVDESHLRMPGYRDRIVTIYHDAQEGGINLNMDPTVVQNLARRGGCAADKIVEHFAGPRPGVESTWAWDNHRWIRFRTSTGGLEQWLRGWRHGYETPSPGGRPYDELAGPHARATLPSYRRFVRNQRGAINRRTGELLDVAADWGSMPADAFSRGGPAPAPWLRLVPADGSPGADVEPDPPSDPPSTTEP